VSDLLPKLKSGAIAQYPLTRTLRFSTKVLRFLDGTEQAFPLNSKVLAEWQVPLERLDDGELNGVDQLFMTHQGSSQTFSFVDPLDQTEHSNCNLASDESTIELESVNDGKAIVTVREVND
jgi:hypothetical protein